MNLRFHLGTAAVGCALLATTIVAAAPPREIAITANDTMKYSIETIEAKPGEMLTVKLTNVGTMPKMAAAHDFVLLAKGTNVDQLTTDGIMARDTDYIAAKYKKDVLAKTKLLGPGESDSVTFKAPTAPGSYAYICTFPGHYASGMKGTLVVK